METLEQLHKKNYQLKNFPKYRAVLENYNEDMIYISEGCESDGGATTLGRLFGHDADDLSGISDILTSLHFINETDEPHWEAGWSCIDVQEFTHWKDAEDIEIYDGDILKETDSNPDEPNQLICVVKDVVNNIYKYMKEQS